MLTEKELIQIGKKECVTMLGEINFEKYKHLCCLFHSSNDEFFTVGIGMDTKERMTNEDIVFGNTKMEYYAIVNIDPNSGAVYRDMENSLLPHNNDSIDLQKGGKYLIQNKQERRRNND